MHARYLAGLLLALLVGCGPTRTAGTEGKPVNELAVLSVPQLPDEVHVQMHTVQFDGGGDQYDIGNGRDFYLLPGDHTATFSFQAEVPGFGGLFVPKSALTIPGPKDVPLGNVTAGKTYDLAPSIDSFDKLLQGDGFSLVKEKEKAK